MSPELLLNGPPRTWCTDVGLEAGAANALCILAGIAYGELEVDSALVSQA